LNKVVVRFMNGQLIKGSTRDFAATKTAFHVASSDSPANAKPVLVEFKDLKAVFFVKDFAGNPAYRPRQEFDATRPVLGKKIKVVFKDGETLVGTTQGYQPGRPGFFMIPADDDSNLERCFVISAATQEISFL
jgi:hypothetical protein